MRRAVIFTILLAILLAACGDDDGAATETTAATAAIDTPEYLAFRSQPTACGAEAPDPALQLQFGAPEDLGLSGIVTATIETSCGPVTLELDTALAPATVNSFVFLAEQGYFDGTAVHRAYQGFMVQMGDPTASGRGNPGYLLADELPPAGFAYTRGVVAMANGGPNSAGSQFFMMLGEAPLPPSYSVFGRVTAGLDTLEAIVGLPMGPNPGDAIPTRPLETVYIESVDVTR